MLLVDTISEICIQPFCILQTYTYQGKCKLYKSQSQMCDVGARHFSDCKIFELELLSEFQNNTTNTHKNKQFVYIRELLILWLMSFFFLGMIATSLSCAIPRNLLCSACDDKCQSIYV